MVCSINDMNRVRIITSEFLYSRAVRGFGGARDGGDLGRRLKRGDDCAYNGSPVAFAISVGSYHF